MIGKSYFDNAMLSISIVALPLKVDYVVSIGSLFLS